MPAPTLTTTGAGALNTSMSKAALTATGVTTETTSMSKAMANELIAPAAGALGVLLGVAAAVV